ncbi:hypothetical protein MKX03_037827 [Papaver bracteatum]|nr:hypothetical protein MKX03_037827 [Papaver bracteatum]
MGIDIYHYVVLVLPSGEQGAKLTDADINKAYKTKALELHQDKCPDDPIANSNFLQIQSSYETLKDKLSRLGFRKPPPTQSSQCDSIKRKTMADLHERERAAFGPDPDRLAREDEEEKYNKMQALDRKKKIKAECFVEYSADRLKELFGKFGVVAYVVVKKSSSKKKKKKKWSALLDMASIYDVVAVAAVKVVQGDFSDRLLVSRLPTKA